MRKIAAVKYDRSRETIKRLRVVQVYLYSQKSLQTEATHITPRTVSYGIVGLYGHKISKKKRQVEVHIQDIALYTPVGLLLHDNTQTM